MVGNADPHRYDPPDPSDDDDEYDDEDDDDDDDDETPGDRAGDESVRSSKSEAEFPAAGASGALRLFSLQVRTIFFKCLTFLKSFFVIFRKPFTEKFSNFCFEIRGNLII